MSPCIGGYVIFALRSSLRVGVFFWDRFLCATLQVWPLISRCASSCVFCFYFNKGYIVSNGKTKAFVHRYPLLIRLLSAKEVIIFLLMLDALA